MTDSASLLVTGASSGVGRSLVHRYKERFHVVGLARRLGRMQEEFGDYEQVDCHRVDLSDLRELKATLDSLRARYGGIHYLLNNAGVRRGGRVDELAGDDLTYSFEVNTQAPALIMRELLQDMTRAGFGRIVNITSGAALECPRGYGAYSASKAALNALTRTAAREHGDSNIKINLMSPGPVRTEMAPEAPMDPSACHETVDYLLSLDQDGPTGSFFWLGHELPLTPDLDGVKWSDGEAPSEYRVFD